MVSLLLLFSSMPICQAKLGLGEPKVSCIEFYLHDLLVAEKPTAVIVAEANTAKASPTLFGEVVVVDDPLTKGPELTSKVIGKAQGLYAYSSQSELSLIEGMNFVFTDGKFNGSTLTVMGRNPVLHKVRELSINGGSGVFRLARGYILKQTYSVDLTTQNAVVHYNVTVLHYRGILISISFLNDSMRRKFPCVVLT
ncbi:dirigent protein 22 [Amborella trichopoda]|nr:dirigent protein 22 [Amborella trichopoda]|eukprot:XP_006851956.2 dirigent protein 22 [Amborella trichopoda]